MCRALLGRLAVVALAAAAAGAGGCSKHWMKGDFGAPTPISIVPDASHARETPSQENARLTRRGEELSRVEPFVASGAAPARSEGTPDASSSSRPGELTIRVSTDRPTAAKTDEAGPSHSTSTPTKKDETPDSYSITMSGWVNLTPQVFGRLLTDYRDDRVLQIDRACSHYFSELDSLAGNVDFSSQLINIGGDYITVLMGLAGSPAKHLAVLAGGQAAFNQTVDATRALLLLNPAPSAVRALVNASQRRLLQTAEADKEVTHAKVERLVQAYALACTPIGIRAIVNEAVTERALVEDPDRTGPAAQAALAELTTLLNAGQGADTQISALDAGAAAHLLWVMDTPNCNSEACEAYKRSKERYPALVAAYDRLTDKTAVRAKLTQITAVETSIGVRRATLQNDLINESKDREKAALLERTKELENDLSNLRTRLSTAENLATSQQTEIKRLEAAASASQITSGSQGAPAAPSPVGPAPEGQ